MGKIVVRSAQCQSAMRRHDRIPFACGGRLRGLIFMNEYKTPEQEEPAIFSAEKQEIAKYVSGVLKTEREKRGLKKLDVGQAFGPYIGVSGISAADIIGQFE